MKTNRIRKSLFQFFIFSFFMFLVPNCYYYYQCQCVAMIHCQLYRPFFPLHCPDWTRLSLLPSKKWPPWNLIFCEFVQLAPALWSKSKYYIIGYLSAYWAGPFVLEYTHSTLVTDPSVAARHYYAVRRVLEANCTKYFFEFRRVCWTIVFLFLFSRGG